ncbi:NTF2-like protein [Agrocybe pediades]|nr:NTF2-like protein [Agrocybe pediades]
MPAEYDPNEAPVSLPSAPLITLAPNVVLQPPLSRRGTGPGIIVILPENIELSTSSTKPLDPEPVLKWAEEGFAVVGITATPDLLVEQALKQSVDALVALDEVDVKDKVAVIVYDSKLVYSVSDTLAGDPRVVAFVGYGSFPSPACTLPILLHLTSNAPRPRHAPSDLTTQHTYKTTSTTFVLPQTANYDPGHATLAHSRSLVFLKKHLGGPFFDLEAIWDEHCYFEFEERSVAKTMGTMVAEPYVNHIPTMTGGIGRKALTEFYRDHFIFSNPEDVSLQVVSRTVGPDRVIDEFVSHLTHTRTIDWLLPGVPPTGRKLAIPMMAVVNIRGDRLYNEHIWWDQATALKQAGVLPSYVPFTDSNASASDGPKLLRLPVAGVESANMLIDESKGTSNEMFGPDWGVTNAQKE